MSSPAWSAFLRANFETSGVNVMLLKSVYVPCRLHVIMVKFTIQWPLRLVGGLGTLYTIRDDVYGCSKADRRPA